MILAAASNAKTFWFVTRGTGVVALLLLTASLVLGVLTTLAKEVLTLPWDDDVQKLWRSATAHPDKCDTELSRSEQQAYDRVVRRIDDLWSYRPGVDQPRS